MEPAIGRPTEPPTEPFTLLHELGRGGMGVVYLAEDHKAGDRCAVKLLHLHVTQDETSMTRFQSEARTAGAIDHPAIVKIRGNISRLSDGQWYCMMEYLDGQTLTEFCAQRGPLPLALVLELIAPICDALDHAHAAGIIHRNLKPDNVIVVLRADTHVPKLLDFGIAKLIDEPAVTRSSAVPGTTAYMAPEQLRGDPVDRRCDVYALGVLVYQMITGGQLPYDAPHGAQYHARMTQPPIDPRRRCAGVPDAAVGPMLAAIHIDPAQRPTTAGAFALLLARILVGQTPQTDGVAILQRCAPRLLVTTNLQETLRAPGLRGVRGSGAWSYDYIAVLGKGGFGEVLRGVKHGAPGFALPVAIKRILHEHAENPAFVEMFHQEARVAALLGEHPNIVKVLDHATDPSGQLAIVMEYIDGIDLDKLRRSGPIPHAVVIFLMSEVLEGLGHAHHLPLPSVGSSADEIAVRGQVRGVIHRDMSPHNVMISWYGAVKVMDFGIAKLRTATVAPGSVMLKGKPGYMSPEQANTEVEIDGRSDLFAIGIILWELLAGRSLFERNDDYRVTIAAVLFAPIPRPSVCNPGVPLDLEQVVMRLLERDLTNRYQTAREAFVALTACTAASRSAKIELQQLLRARFPQSAAHAAIPPSPHASNEPAPARTAPDSPRAFGLASPARASGPAESTHGHAFGRSGAHTNASAPVRRALRVAAAMVTLGVACTVALVMGRHGREATSAESEPDRGAAPAVASAAPMAIPPLPLPPPSPSPQAAPVPQGTLAGTAPSSPTAVHPLSTMVIATEPSDAMVRVEDATTLIAAGRSPLTVSIPRGAHIQIHAEASGFEPATTATTIGAQDRQTVALTLVPTARPAPHPLTAVQQSASTPIAKPATRSAPDEDKSITHATRPTGATVLTDAGAKPLTLETPTSSEAQRGELAIIVKPWAMVSINGRPAGQTPYRRTLPIGSYRVRLVNDNADKDETMTVMVSRGQTTNIERTWVRR